MTTRMQEAMNSLIDFANTNGVEISDVASQMGEDFASWIGRKNAVSKLREYARGTIEMGIDMDEDTMSLAMIGIVKTAETPNSKFRHMPAEEVEAFFAELEEGILRGDDPSKAESEDMWNRIEKAARS